MLDSTMGACSHGKKVLELEQKVQQEKEAKEEAEKEAKEKAAAKSAAAEAARLGDELVRSDCEWRRMVHLLEGELVASRRTVTRLEVEISRD